MATGRGSEAVAGPLGLLRTRSEREACRWAAIGPTRLSRRLAVSSCLAGGLNPQCRSMCPCLHDVASRELSRRKCSFLAPCRRDVALLCRGQYSNPLYGTDILDSEAD